MIAWLVACGAVQEPADAQEREAGNNSTQPLQMIVWGEPVDNEPASMQRTYYLERRIAPTMGFGGASWLVRSERESEESVAEMLDNLQVKSGMIVADFGCGVGFHSLPLAQQVAPDGKVYAIDIQAPMLRSLVARALEAQTLNIVPVLSRANVPQLPTELFDMVLMVDVYHELNRPAETLQQIRKSLRPGGRIALVEYRGEDPDVPILPEHKMTKQQILKEYQANGFELRSEYDGLPWQHLMFFGVKEN